jgi:AraC family transcriptional regulator
MVGETPLELHRRLRMERAALRLLSGRDNVTEIAFDSGYDSHESFTRAFRSAYGVPPSEFRQPATVGETSQATAASGNCRRPRQIELPCRSGIHLRTDGSINVSVPFTPGGHAMDVEITEMPEFRLAAIRHIGPYTAISEAFGKLGEIAARSGLLQSPDVNMIGVFYDDPETTPPNQLQSDAALSIAKDAVLPGGVTEGWLPAGRYARTVHCGPYTGLPDTWARFMGEWLPRSGHQPGRAVSYEIYRNTPMTVPPEELRTELYLPLG